MIDHTKDLELKLQCIGCGAIGVALHIGHNENTRCHIPQIQDGVAYSYCGNCLKKDN